MVCLELQFALPGIHTSVCVERSLDPASGLSRTASGLERIRLSLATPPETFSWLFEDGTGLWKLYDRRTARQFAPSLHGTMFSCSAPRARAVVCAFV